MAACLWIALLAPGSAGAATNNIFTVAGTGISGFSGDGGPATGAELNFPVDVAATPDGGFLIVDKFNDRVRRVTPSGIVVTVAGTGSAGFSGDGGPAVAAQLNRPSGVDVTADGGFLVTDQFNHRVRRVSPSGTISTVAGVGVPGFSGDGGAATAAQLSFPDDVAATADGGFLIAEGDNDRVRRVSPSGIITTAAGTGLPGSSGDGGPATAAQLSFPTGVAATADGGFLIADWSNDRVRRVSPAGIITTVAGVGVAGFSGDGGPATAAGLSAPGDVAPTPDGGFLIADSENDRVRRVAPSGRITTVAGNGVDGAAGDGGLAGAAELGRPSGVAATADGGFLIADDANHRIRFVDADLRGPASGPQGPAGPSGSDGAPGPPGPPGQPSAPPARVVVQRLAVALASGRYSTRPGARLRLRYAATSRAAVTVTLRGRGKAPRARGRSREGRSQIAVRAPRRAGRYAIRLVARSADGQVARDKATLLVRSGRRSSGAGRSRASAIGALPLAATRAVRGVVKAVVDGQAVRLEVGGRTVLYRLRGVRAPRLGRCDGKAAKAALRRLLRPGAAVQIRGRPAAADLRIRGRSVSLAVIAAGHARVRSTGSKALDRRLQAAQRRARSRGAGLWGDCGRADPRSPGVRPPQDGDEKARQMEAVMALLRGSSVYTTKTTSTGSTTTTDERIAHLCSDGRLLYATQSLISDGSGGSFNDSTEAAGTWRLVDALVDEASGVRRAVIEYAIEQGDGAGERGRTVLDINADGQSGRWDGDAARFARSESCT